MIFLQDFLLAFKPKDLLLVQKFVRRTKGRKREIVSSQIYEKAEKQKPEADAPKEEKNSGLESCLKKFEELAY